MNRRQVLAAMGVAGGAALMPAVPGQTAGPALRVPASENATHPPESSSTLVAGTPPIGLNAAVLPDDNGRLFISAFADVPLSSVKLTVYTAEGGDLLGTLTAFVPIGPEANGRIYWWSSETLMLPSLGRFWAVWEAVSFDGGTSVLEQDLYYWSLVRFASYTVTPLTVTAMARDITISGQVLKKHPGTLAETPLQNAEITLGHPFGTGQQQKPRSDADGRFNIAGSVSMTGSISCLVEMDHVAGHWIAFGPYANITVVPTPVRITANVDKTQVTNDTPVTLSGRLDRWDGQNWLPFAGQTIDCQFLQGGNSSHSWPIATDTSGNFTWTSTQLPAGTSFRYRMYFNTSISDPYYEAADVTTEEVHVTYTYRFDSPLSLSSTGQDYFAVSGSMAGVDRISPTIYRRPSKSSTRRDPHAGGRPSPAHTSCKTKPSTTASAVPALASSAPPYSSPHTPRNSQPQHR